MCRSTNNKFGGKHLCNWLRILIVDALQQPIYGLFHHLSTAACHFGRERYRGNHHTVNLLIQQLGQHVINLFILVDYKQHPFMPTLLQFAHKDIQHSGVKWVNHIRHNNTDYI